VSDENKVLTMCGMYSSYIVTRIVTWGGGGCYSLSTQFCMTSSKLERYDHEFSVFKIFNACFDFDASYKFG
jgi:hypothetical protein